MISIVDKVECSACGACEQCCPKRCISFKEDHEGFLYPVVDHTLCIECGLCEQVCPIIHHGTATKPQKSYAAINQNDDIRRRSSSGGIFTLLAQRVLDEGGVVFGARFDKRWEVEHHYTESVEGLEELRVAKYMQSRGGDSFKQVRSFLRDGRRVLFVGTPCQAAGLRRYLGREHEGLLIVDSVCHGTPSPKVWRQYLGELIGTNQESISGISFRDKADGGWSSYNFKVWGADGVPLFTERFDENIYMKGMLRDLTLRPSCYQCSAKSGRSLSDITIGDFWGVGALPPTLNDNKGVSLVLLNTPKGAKSFPLDETNFKECSLAECQRLNGGFNERLRRHPRRERLFEAIDTTPSIIELLGEILRERPIERVARKCKYIMNYILRR